MPLLLLPFLGLWVPPLFDLDEGAFTAATTEMFLRGDYLSTYLLGQPRFDKPILIYWLQAVSALGMGFNEWSFRFPSALAASVWILVTYAFVRRVADGRQALLAALVVATAAGLTVIQRAATADALLNLWLACAGYATWLWLREERPAWRYASHAAMALGFLTKGPVAVLIPAGAAFLWCLSRGEWRQGLSRFFRWAIEWRAVLLFLAIALPWFVAQYFHEGPGFLTGFFFKHNLSRFETPMEGHGGNYLYYVPVVLISLLPFTGLLLGATTRLSQLWQDDLLRYGLLWFMLAFALFSFSGTKLPHYVYYGYGGLVLLLARQGAGPMNRWLLLLPGSLLFAVLLAVPWLLQQALPGLKADDRLLLQDLDAAFDTGYWLWFAGALGISLVLLLRGIPLRTALYANGLLASIGIAAFLLPAVGAVQQEPVKAAGLLARDLNGPLVMQGVNTPSFQTYAQRRVERRTPRPGDLVLTRQGHLEHLGRAEVIYQQRGYLLLRMQ